MRFDTLAEWLVWQEALHPKAIDLGLGRVRKVFQALMPQPRMPVTLTVGGTNGKGSCVAMLDAMLRAQGYRVGAYTSPHLLRYNERIRIAGEAVDDAVLCQAFDRIDQARGDITLSYFEFGTLAALDIFSRSDLDVQILEVGLGGRLDAVNLIDADGALVASIDIDHQDWLGNTRSQIALEKAGIFRAGRPAVVGDPQAPESLYEYAREAGLSLSCQGREFGFQRCDGGGWNWRGEGEMLELPVPALRGDHQYLNAAAVIQLLRLVRRQLPVADDAIRRGLATVQLTGRFQLVEEGPVPVLLDVAHNPQSVQVLADHLRREYPGRRIHAVFAVMKDKDIVGVLNPIKDLVSHWYLAPLNMARAASADSLREVFRKIGVAGVDSGFPDPASAFAAARLNAQNGDLVVVFGSFFLVSEFLAQQAVHGLR
jgi:dihydrofolate synthase/folylpolyglutamate synthase